jgi:hypothetical protein
MREVHAVPGDDNFGELKGNQGGQKGAFHELVGRALADPAFRAQLKDPAQRGEALASAKVASTPELNSALDEAIDSVDNLAKQFGDVQAAT